jgi:hypothetical protein
MIGFHDEAHIEAATATEAVRCRCAAELFPIRENRHPAVAGQPAEEGRRRSSTRGGG